MINFTSEESMTAFLHTPLAELERFYCPPKVIAAVERSIGIYVKDLECVTWEEMVSCENIGKDMIKALTDALSCLLVEVEHEYGLEAIRAAQKTGRSVA